MNIIQNCEELLKAIFVVKLVPDDILQKVLIFVQEKNYFSTKVSNSLIKQDACLLK